MHLFMGSTYSLLYFRSVSCKSPDGPQRRLSDSVVSLVWPDPTWHGLGLVMRDYSVLGRRVSLHCDLVIVVLYESEPGFPLILPGYLVGYI